MEKEFDKERAKEILQSIAIMAVRAQEALSDHDLQYCLNFMWDAMVDIEGDIELLRKITPFEAED